MKNNLRGLLAIFVSMLTIGGFTYLFMIIFGEIGIFIGLLLGGYLSLNNFNRFGYKSLDDEYKKDGLL